jgi:cytochrome bd-type quinol oxidase subunit 2
VSDRALLIAHAVLGFAALFAGTHHAAYALLSASGRPRPRALRRFMWIAPATVIAQAALGLAIYPAYRLRVRANLDLHAPAVAQLFELKEHLAALAFALVIGASLAGGSDSRAEARWPVAAVSCTGAAFLWATALIGLYVTARQPL